MTRLPQPVRAVTVTAPSRLHFGMFSFGRDDVRQFGGVGAMVEQPALRLTIEPADRFDVRGHHATRVRQAAERILANLPPELSGDGIENLELAIEVNDAPRQHVGLGSGTQLGLGLVIGLSAALGLPAPDIHNAVRLSGRAIRSAVGTYGFHLGGLIIEAGKRQPDELSPLVLREDLPDGWTFVLFTPRNQAGLSGDQERAAFSRLPPVSNEAAAALAREAFLELVPAAVEQDFRAFAASLYRFNHAAGLLFAAVQGGPYSPGPTTTLIENLRAQGIEGVGQTSWGPTVFACFPEPRAALDFVHDWQSESIANGFEAVVAPVTNKGDALDDA
jgi:beta-ribofuranosylaminobenzene 5'-phosphate synthase